MEVVLESTPHLYPRCRTLDCGLSGLCVIAVCGFAHAQQMYYPNLPDIARKLQGKHVLSDGRPFTVDTEYLSAASMNSDQLISAFMQKRAALIEWNIEFVCSLRGGWRQPSRRFQQHSYQRDPKTPAARSSICPTK